jgi:hypothetical protein
MKLLAGALVAMLSGLAARDAHVSTQGFPLQGTWTLVAADKPDGSVDELRSAVIGSSTHYGTMTIDERAGELVFSIEGSSFPNWEGTTQRRQYTLDGAQLRYEVPPRADASIPVSAWHRLD